jgi:DNA-binding MarR family transcriptional regulator
MTPALSLDRQLCFAVYSAEHAFTRFYRRLLGPLGLTYPQYLVLLVLWEHDDLVVSDIGQRLGLDSGTLTPLLKRMEAAGIIRRRRDAGDERQVRVTLTAQGRALRARAEEFPRRVGLASSCSAEQLASLLASLTGLRRALDAA